MDFSAAVFTKHTFNDAFDIPNTNSTLVSILLVLAVTSPVWGSILLLIVVAIIVYRVMKKRKRTA